VEKSDKIQPLPNVEDVFPVGDREMWPWSCLLTPRKIEMFDSKKGGLVQIVFNF